MLKTLEELINIIRERKNSDPERSYTKKLLSNADNAQARGSILSP